MNSARMSRRRRITPLAPYMSTAASRLTSKRANDTFLSPTADRTTARTRQRGTHPDLKPNNEELSRLRRSADHFSVHEPSAMRPWSGGGRSTSPADPSPAAVAVRRAKVGNIRRFRRRRVVAGGPPLPVAVPSTPPEAELGVCMKPVFRRRDWPCRVELSRFSLGCVSERLVDGVRERQAPTLPAAPLGQRVGTGEYVRHARGVVCEPGAVTAGSRRQQPRRRPHTGSLSGRR
jgi:hypothetical protein